MDAARPGRCGYFRMCSRLMEIVTNRSPRSAAEAPTAATKKSCQARAEYELTEGILALMQPGFSQDG